MTHPFQITAAATLLLTALATGFTATAQTFEEGMRAYQSGNYDTAYRTFQGLAEEDDHRAQGSNTERGTPVLIFVARLTPGDRFTKTLSESEANFVEQHLISLSLRNNPELKNIRNTKLVKSIQIPGILNSPQGAPSSGATLLRQILGV